ncbi:uncharacterized protein LOC121736231 [Aricia agestis]|uniref:uncharacterized protein LOC121736231 n=1 Tax=Aricia agestis TaxID=91739 RepID=UPI001C2072CA|nr:uncharacterized protein LOC121736231 [Aricia agestis]
MKKLSNDVTSHIAHTFILVAVLWEAVFRPRQEPKSHTRNVVHALSVVGLYIVVMSYTYKTAGTWLYPFYDESYGTIYFPLIHLVTCLLTVGSYYAQWPISRITLFSKHLGKSNKLLLNTNIQKRLQ